MAVQFRDLHQADLEALGWAGGEAHQRALADALQSSWAGDVDGLVAELPTGVLVAHGFVDHRKHAGSGWLWMLATRDDWRGLGLGSAMVAALEQRAAEHGHTHAMLAVEHDNPRAASLYRRLGYRSVDTIVESWPEDSGRTYVTVCEQLVKRLGPHGPGW